MSPEEIRAMGVELAKLAEGEDHVPNPGRHALKTFAAGTGGLVAGTALGFGAAHAVDLLHQKATGRQLPLGKILPAAALLSTAAATAYNTYKMHELEEMQRAFRSWQQANKPGT